MDLFRPSLVLYKRKVVGVYSSATTLSAPDVPAPARLPIGQALRKYWWTLVGIFLFPAAAFIGTELIHIPFEFFILPFFAVAFLAGWPYFSGKSSYSFWLVAVGVYMLGAILAALLVQVVRAIAA